MNCDVALLSRLPEGGYGDTGTPEEEKPCDAQKQYTHCHLERKVQTEEITRVLKIRTPEGKMITYESMISRYLCKYLP